MGRASLSVDTFFFRRRLTWFGLLKDREKEKQEKLEEELKSG